MSEIILVCNACGWEGGPGDAYFNQVLSVYLCPRWMEHERHSFSVTGLLHFKTIPDFLEEAITTNKLLKMLFVDDRSDRMRDAKVKYGMEYDITFATCVPEALRLLCGQEWDVVSLDHDLDGHDFQDMNSPNCGMEIVRYIVNSGGWIEAWRKMPQFWIHSKNLFAVRKMLDMLEEVGIHAKSVGWKKWQVGVVAGAFSIIHPGYIRLLKESKDLCHRVIVLLHDKPDQVLSVDERKETLLSLKYVDEVQIYGTEEDLDGLLERIRPDIRILGSDHKDKTSRPKWPAYYHERDHDWSATKFKIMISEEVKRKGLS